MVLTKKKTLFAIFSLLASFCYASSVSSASISSFSVSSDTVNIDLTPTATTTSSATGSHIATITTDCTLGYKIYVSMSSSSEDNKLHLNGQKTNNTVGQNAIGPVSGNLSSMSVLSSNTWGVRSGSGSSSSAFAAVPSYSAISATSQSSNPDALITSSSAASSGVSYIVTYGANVTDALTPGNYSGDVLYTAIMNSSCYTAQVNATKYTDTASTNGISSISGVTSGDYYAVGSSQTVTCNPAAGYSCTWYNGSTQVSTTNSYTFTVPAGGISLIARATIDSYTLTTTNDDTTHISSITSGGSKQYNSSQTVICTPATGYSCSWYNGTTQVSTGDTYTFNMPASDLTLTAKSSVNSYTLTVSNGNTTAIASVSGSGSKAYGSSVTVTCTPNSGYKCTGWTSSDTSLVANSTSVSYTFTMPAGNVTLTANAETEATVTYMQGWTGCNSLSKGYSITLTDSRDGNEYTIKKLKDGKCWMTQNLRLIDKTITSSDSNIASSFTVPASSTGWGSKSDGNSATSTKTYDTGDTLHGVLYNYVTARAGTSWHGGGITSGYFIQDICPKGWRLPTGASSGEFAALDVAYGGTGENRSNANTYSNFIGSDMSFVLSGYYSSGSLTGVGTYGTYWSSSQHDDEYVYTLTLLSLNNNLGPQPIGKKFTGYSIRCIAKPDSEKTIADIYYMQEIKSTIVSNTLQGASATLTDKRDGNTYTVKKLNDGKIWMTQNLRLIDKTITSSDSNIAASSFTVPASSTDWGSTSDGNSATSTKTYDTGDASYGVLYNYTTASAGTSWYGGGVSSGKLARDICPKGWRLPTGGSSGEFVTLDKAYGGTGANRTNANTYSKFTDSDMSFVLPGNYDSGSHNDVGTYGAYWSSSQYNGSNAYYLGLYSSNSRLALRDYYTKYSGLSVRCLAK